MKKYLINDNCRYGPGLDRAEIGKRNIVIIQSVNRKGEDIKAGGHVFESLVRC